ncbi:hypothetical protein, partial [Pseudorhodoplanes sp.]|uniref:hypothetical protein n=1 Tax=Pseudorhodoplanes sp. TaxID=1934341 RepID=UPI002D7E7638
DPMEAVGLLGRAQEQRPAAPGSLQLVRQARNRAAAENHSRRERGVDKGLHSIRFLPVLVLSVSFKSGAMSKNSHRSPRTANFAMRDYP